MALATGVCLTIHDSRQTTLEAISTINNRSEAWRAVLSGCINWRFPEPLLAAGARGAKDVTHTVAGSPPVRMRQGGHLAARTPGTAAADTTMVMVPAWAMRQPYTALRQAEPTRLTPRSI
jgi:hypothetical protein